MKTLGHTIILIIASFPWNPSLAQCNNSLYSLSSSGIIYSVSTTNASLTAVNTSAPKNATMANALAYAGGTTPTFYFFANSQAGSLVFVSYVSTTRTFTTLSTASGRNATPNLPTGTVNSGCIAPTYQGYYCMDTNGYLYYYNIAANSWTMITNVIKDQTGADITSTAATYSSGDMAFDGNGNLWLLLANKSTSQYGLYEVQASVPTTSVSFITAKQVVDLGRSMPDGNDPVGIAFDPAGQMYISTVNPNTGTPSDLYLWTSPNAFPQQVGTAPMGQTILDLASCSMPMTMALLPVTFEQVTATVTAQGTITLYWMAAQQANVRDYRVERSGDGFHWEGIGSRTAKEALGSYSFSDDHPLRGNSYYRLVETDLNGQTLYSSVVSVQLKGTPALRLWPNPAMEVLYADNSFSQPIKADIFDASGTRLLEKLLEPGINRITIATLLPGIYVLRLSDAPSILPVSFVKLR